MAEVLPSNVLTDEHRRIDAGIKQASDGNLSGLAAALQLLRRHLYVEEAVAFAALEKVGQGGPTFVMKREHGMMWPLIETLGKVPAGDATPAVRESGRKLYQLLRMHNPKEESLVYTALDRFAGQQGDGKLAQAMAAAKLPAGWRCAMAPKVP